MNQPTPGNAGLSTPEGKIFPRNLTARAAHVVRGNPSGSRPESGVDNCFPGLEFDQRNLDKAFFRGLLFDFHHGSGSRLLAVKGGVAEDQGISDADLGDSAGDAEQRLYLWAVCGRTTVDQEENEAPVFHAVDLTGPEMWRRVHDLLPGKISIVVGRGSGSRSPGAFWVPGGLNAWRTQGRNAVQRDDAGVLEVAILTAERADYLDQDGVIEPDVYEPGDLTRSLCAPWQYDFRECGCYYWAASKPDISATSGGEYRNLNFQRRDRTTVPPAPDLTTFLERGPLEIDHPELIMNWNVLPVVLNGREDDALGVPAPLDLPLMKPQDVIEELTRLATVEHALCLEYLYAHYSLAAPMTLPEGTPEDVPVRRVFAAAQEIFGVAEDEMRHLRWVNEILGVLGRPLQLDRPADDFVIQRQTGHRFKLERLTPEQLEWFIAVEKPSAQVDPDGIDGMYVRLHHTITKNPSAFPQAERLAHLIKLIIDEGDDHYHRFTAIRGHLAGLDPDGYLRRLAPPNDTMGRELLRLADLDYAMVLGALRATMEAGDSAGGLLRAQAVRSMRNLHEINHLLAARGVAPRFAAPSPALSDGQAPRAAARAVSEVVRSIRSLGDESLQEQLDRQEEGARALVAACSLQ
ncbi:ferritin-like domain-containing protein [Streptomyces sp. ID05-39B]|uniref:ferritin-like domain-containing protein n=1 Tax=Streptomyces sp. ID05-39B TaxID=3028664 RepID=UPI0029AFC2F3|nr:ferritin-like domain-containing protein [Streptomyces sp. ID05-39B]MDX3528949.1 ferritin-like domain-containing protein [Streptomyces sp. ID05-39B]